jgi:hypothetical protein
MISKNYKPTIMREKTNFKAFKVECNEKIFFFDNLVSGTRNDCWCEPPKSDYSFFQSPVIHRFYVAN